MKSPSSELAPAQHGLGTLVEIAIGGEPAEAIDAAFEDISLTGPHWLQ